jgi:hypothetical protein
VSTYSPPANITQAPITAASTITEDPITAASTSTTPTPTPLDYRNIGYKLVMWDDFNFTGRWQSIDKVGSYSLGFRAKSLYWRCGIYTATEKCSVGYCAGEDFVGWRGGYDHTNATIHTPFPDSAKIVCGAAFADPGCDLVPDPTTLPIQDSTISAPTPPPSTITESI